MRGLRWTGQISASTAAAGALGRVHPEGPVAGSIQQEALAGCLAAHCRGQPEHKLWEERTLPRR